MASNMSKVHRLPRFSVPFILPALSCVWLATGPALGNGGGYYRGGVENTGAVAGFEPSGTEHIRILDEQLDVRLGPEEAEVEVRYLMRNESDKPMSIRFGFPVEESMGDVQPAHHEEPKYCRDYAVTAAGKPLKVSFKRETEKKDARFKHLHGWLVSTMRFRGGEEKPVTICFRSVYPESNQFVSQNDYLSAKVFRYRLSTGACWAGSIRNGRIVIRPKGIDPAELRIIKPVNRFKKDGEAWVWEFKNLEPTLADDLEIEAVPEINSYARVNRDKTPTEWTTYIDRGGSWFMAHRNYAAKASSTLPPDGERRYNVANLNDDYWNHAWSEGAPGPGIGEWLEIRPKVPKPLVALRILPGYARPEKLFKANARPKKIKVELNGEYSFTASVKDKRAWQWIPVRGYGKPVKLVKITFEDVWEGSRYEDLCVTGLALVVKLDKKPIDTSCR